MLHSLVAAPCIRSVVSVSAMLESGGESAYNNWTNSSSFHPFMVITTASFCFANSRKRATFGEHA